MNNLMKFEIVENDEYANYVLKDIDGNKYDMNINFMNMEKPKVGTIIFFNKSLIDENVSINFGFIDDDPIKEDEFAIIMNGDEKIYLKRYYG